MALTTTDISNAITRASCCIADMQYKLALKRAQGSKDADCLERKIFVLTMFLESLNNVLDCTSGEPLNPQGNSCNLDALSGGYCWDAGSETLYVMIAAGDSSAAPYTSYYYEYYIGEDVAGPWTEIAGFNSNYAIIPIDVDGDYLRILMYCNEGDASFREEIVQFKTYPPEFDAVTFGYFTTDSDTSLSVIPSLWTLHDGETVTISNQNADFIISNIEINNISVATNVQSVNLSIGVDIQDGDIMEIFFQYIGEAIAPPCDLYRLINISVVPDPIIVASNTVMCPGGTVDLSVTNFSYDSYLWSTGETTFNITVSLPGVYSVAVSSGGITNLIDYQTITDDGINPIFTLQLSGVDLEEEVYACQGGLPSSLLLHESTGISLVGATLAIFDGGGFEIVSGLPINTPIDANTIGSDAIQGVVTLSNNCTYYTPLYHVYTLNPVLNTLHSNCSCAGLSDGVISATPLATTVGVLFITSIDFELRDSLNNIIDTSTGLFYSITGLAADSYTLNYVTHWIDGSYCPGTQPVTITTPTAISLSTSASVELCDVSNGGSGVVSITYTMSGGVGPYDIYFDGVLVASAQTTGYVYQAAIANGTYTTTVTDTNNCSDSDSVTITNPVAIAVTTTTSGVGGVRIDTLTGGSGTYVTKELYENDLVTLVGTFGVIPDTVLTGGSGTFWILIIDSNGCALVQSVNVT